MAERRVTPRPDELAVVRLEADDVVTVVTADGEHVFRGETVEVDGVVHALTTAVQVPFDGPRVGWLAGGWASGGPRLSLGRTRADRPFWQAAEKLLTAYPVIYVRMVEQPYYRRTRWVPVAMRVHEDDQ